MEKIKKKLNIIQTTVLLYIVQRLTNDSELLHDLSRIDSISICRCWDFIIMHKA